MKKNPTALARLLVMEAHDSVFHQKVLPTLTQLRSEYWIPNGRICEKGLVEMQLVQPV